MKKGKWGRIFTLRRNIKTLTISTFGGESEVFAEKEKARGRENQKKGKKNGS